MSQPEPLGRSVACRFFGGPWDGKTVLREDAPLRLIVPQFGETRIGPDGPEEVVPQRDVMYRRRGPIVTGTADYEEVTDA